MTFFFIGHRGTRKDFDENTIKAFDYAINSGAMYIEFDVRKTKDNQLIIFHDETLERITNGSGKINSYTYRELKKYRTKKNNQKISLLSDILTIYHNKINFMIELKEKGIHDEIGRMIIEKNIIKNCIISGRSLFEIIKIKKIIPTCLVCYNITKGKDLSLESFLNDEKFNKIKFPIDMISLRSNHVSVEFIEKCHNNDILAFSWDFMTYEDPLQKIKELVKLGIDGILFDDYQNISKIKEWKEFLV